MFSKQQARRDARRYRRRGLDATAQRMVDQLGGQGIDGATVLEVGGGIGAIEIELLRAGAARATNVELSDGYEDEARTLLTASSLDGRVERRLGDFVEQARTWSPRTSSSCTGWSAATRTRRPSSEPRPTALGGCWRSASRGTRAWPAPVSAC